MGETRLVVRSTGPRARFATGDVWDSSAVAQTESSIYIHFLYWVAPQLFDLTSQSLGERFNHINRNMVRATFSLLSALLGFLI